MLLRVVVWCCVLVGVVVVVVVCLCVLFFVFCGKTALCVHSKRSRLYFRNAPVSAIKKRPCHIRHGRFDGTHGSVLKVHKGASRADCLSVCLSVCVSLYFSLPFSLSLTSLSLSRRSLFLSVSCRLSLSVLNDNDKEHSCSWLSLYTQL